MRRSIRSLLFSESGSVAPTVALSLVGLIVAGGVAFDYARLASMDSELQNAADQAALAAASQLDGEDGACSRAAAAARTMVANMTLMANEEGSTSAVTIPDEPGCDATGFIRFYKDIEKTQAAANDEDAKFVEVDVNPREAHFAFTPIVASIPSFRTLSATAFAGLGEAYCKTPPVMICNPQETSTATDFDWTLLEGKGLRLVSVGGGSGSWAPGNFGYLDTGGGSNGAPGLREGLGWGAPPGDCIQANGVDTKPGATVSVTDALNTRFDIYDSNVSCPTGGTCPASINSVKDVRRPANASGGNSCKLHNQGWDLPSNYYNNGTIPSSATTPLATSVIPSAMGHPRDMCHAAPSGAAGRCNGPIGNGNWDRDAYFRTNYVRSSIGDGGEAIGTRWTHDDWVANLGLGTTPKRYEVYVWEMQHRGTTVDGVVVLAASPAGATGATKVAHGVPVCSASQGYGSGQVPDETTPDRRKITVAVVNCLQESVNGNSTGVEVKDWIDVFLVEPSINRGTQTGAGDVYAEVVGTPLNAEQSAVQQVKKAVPYLIE